MAPGATKIKNRPRSKLRAPSRPVKLRPSLLFAMATTPLYRNPTAVVVPSNDTWGGPWERGEGSSRIGLFLTVKL
jgi:hypothetical protein